MQSIVALMICSLRCDEPLVLAISHPVPDTILPLSDKTTYSRTTTICVFSASLRVEFELMLPAKYTMLLLLSTLSACAQSLRNGKLLVTAPHAATFEIFRVMSTSPLRFVAERTARFNSPAVLVPARYLLLGDCSHTFVTVKAATTTHLQAYHLVFTPPHKAEAKAAFSVQCQRFATTSSRQHLHNKFSLLLLTPRKKLLVGTTPLNVVYHHSTQRQFALAALQVAPAPHDMRFFVFPRHGLLSATDSQLSGRWLYLLPGEYVVEFNGMRTAINLQQGEEKVIHPATLYIDAPQAAPRAIAHINGNRVVPLNEPLPLPAGRVSLRLMPDSQPLALTLRRGARTVINARRLQVTPACQARGVCTNTTTVSLYRDKADTPFLTTTAGEIFFTGRTVRLGIEGTPRLTHLLPDQLRQVELQLGRLQLQPRRMDSTTQFSDLLRLEAITRPLQGHSDDLSLTRSTELQLLPGRYRLVHYISSANPAVPRQRRSTTFTIHPQRTHRLTVSVFKLKLVARK